MGTLHRTDMLHITARACGVVLMSITISGASSMSDVIRQVKLTAPADRGVITLQLRNRTQGWSIEQNLVMPRPRHSA